MLADTVSAVLPTPFVPLRVTVDGAAVLNIAFVHGDGEVSGEPPPPHPILDAVRHWLDAYADRRFDRLPRLPLAPRGTAFETEVWTELLHVPPGTMATYGDIAERVGRRGAARAVGGAVGRNPIALVVPCHRILGSGGRMTGFGGGANPTGLEIKKWLLEHEGFRVGSASADARAVPAAQGALL